MPHLTRIAPEIPVSDLRESIDYYEQKLGFQNVMEMPDGGYAIVERDSVAIHLFLDDAKEHSPVGIHIFTQELDGLCAELQARGAKLMQGIVTQPWGNRDFRAKDRSGNELKFTEPTSEGA